MRTDTGGVLCKSTRSTRNLRNAIAKCGDTAPPTSVLYRHRAELDMLHQARDLNDLRAPPANRLEALAGDRRGQHSIRINDQWRVCFTWTKEGPENVEVVDYH
jgi:proteic killer suppression protein